MNAFIIAAASETHMNITYLYERLHVLESQQHQGPWTKGTEQSLQWRIDAVKTLLSELEEEENTDFNEEDDYTLRKSAPVMIPASSHYMTLRTRGR